MQTRTWALMRGVASSSPTPGATGSAEKAARCLAGQMLSPQADHLSGTQPGDTAAGLPGMGAGARGHVPVTGRSRAGGKRAEQPGCLQRPG